MKRLLYISLGVLVMSANIQAREWDYFAVYKNPTGLEGWEKVPGSESRVPAFVTGKIKVGTFKDKEGIERPKWEDVKEKQTTVKGIVYTTIDLMKALQFSLQFPKSTDFTIKELPMENNEPVFQICIKKRLYLPNFKPEQREKARFGFENAGVADSGDMWCFTLKNNQGYFKKRIGQK